VDESAFAIALDSAGNAYVTGRAFQSGRGDEVATLKLAAADGDILWAELSGGPAYKNDRGWDIVVGPDDNPVVTGVSVNSDDSANFWTIKYNKNNGSFLWNRSLPGAVNNQMRAGWLEVADNGDIFMANRSWTSTSSYDVVLHRYGAMDGGTIWEIQYGTPSATADDPRSMIRNDAEDLVVAGVSGSDYMVLKFDGATGDTLWTATYDGPAGWYDVATCLALGPAQEVVASGFSDGTGTGWDVATLAFNPATGQELWVLRHDGESQTDEARALAVSDRGDLYIVGYSYSAATNMDMLAQRYVFETLSEVLSVPVVPLALVAHPNPFNPRLNLVFEVASPTLVSLGIFDLRGRVVATLHRGPLPPGSHSVGWNGCGEGGHPVAGGVYVARLTLGNNVLTKKVTLAR
jgi:hypothetical protein